MAFWEGDVVMQAILGFIFQMWDPVQSVGDGWDCVCVCALREYRQFDLVFPKTHLSIISMFLYFGDDIAVPVV